MSPMNRMMNCDDYRHALTEDPGFEDEPGHLDGCAACQAYRDEVLMLDDRIRAALAINVPDLQMPELPEIEPQQQGAANVVALAARRPQSRPVWIALAATVVLAAFLGIRMTGTDGDYGTLETQVLAHVDHEPRALQPSNTPVSERHLLRAVPEDIATMNHDAGVITYAESCVINGKTVPHLVLQGRHGPVTILLMPDEKVSAARSLEGVNVRGIILPVGDGSIAIIGDREEQLENFEQNVRKSVTWNTSI